MFIPIRGLGQLGVVHDSQSQALPIGAWDDARNIRFSGISFEKMLEPTLEMAWDSATNGEALWLQGWSDGLSSYFALAANGNDGSDYLWFWSASGPDNGSWVQAGGPYVPGQWQSFGWGDTCIFNNGENAPQIFNPNDAMFEDLPKWGMISTASDLADSLDDKEASKDTFARCRWILPYKSFLVAGGVTESGVFGPNTVWWSNSTPLAGYSPSSLGTGGPPDWDYESPGSLSGKSEVGVGDGALNWGAVLNENLICYNEGSATAMTFTGGTFVMQFRRLFNKGCAGLHLAAEFNNQHYVVARDQLYVHDGSTVKLIAKDRVEEEFFKRAGKGGRYGVGDIDFTRMQLVKNPDRKELTLIFDENREERVPSDECLPYACNAWTSSASSLGMTSVDTWAPAGEIPEWPIAPRSPDPNYGSNMIHIWVNYVAGATLPEDPALTGGTWGVTDIPELQSAANGFTPVQNTNLLFCEGPIDRFIRMQEIGGAPTIPSALTIGGYEGSNPGQWGDYSWSILFLPYSQTFMDSGVLCQRMGKSWTLYGDQNNGYKPFGSVNGNMSVVASHQGGGIYDIIVSLGENDSNYPAYIDDDTDDGGTDLLQVTIPGINLWEDINYFGVESWSEIRNKKLAVGESYDYVYEVFGGVKVNINGQTAELTSGDLGEGCTRSGPINWNGDPDSSNAPLAEIKSSNLLFEGPVFFNTAVYCLFSAAWKFEDTITRGNADKMYTAFRRSFPEYTPPDTCNTLDGTQIVQKESRGGLVWNFEDDNYTWMDASVDMESSLTEVAMMHYAFDPGWVVRWSDLEPDVPANYWGGPNVGDVPGSLLDEGTRWSDFYNHGTEKNMYWLAEDGVYRSDQQVKINGLKSYYVFRDDIDLDDVVSQWTSHNYKHIRQMFFHIDTWGADAGQPNNFSVNVGSKNNLEDGLSWRPTVVCNLQLTSNTGKHKADFRATGRYLGMLFNFDETSEFKMNGYELDAEEAHGR